MFESLKYKILILIIYIQIFFDILVLQNITMHINIIYFECR